MKDFTLKGPLAVLVSILAAVGTLIGLYVLSTGGGAIEVLGTTNFDTIQVEAGSAAAPSLSFSNDPDVGIYRSAANQLGFSVGGAQVMSVTASGLALEGITLTGPVVGACTGSIVTGTTIAHTLGTTPTFVVLTANSPVTTTPVVLATNTTSITVGFLNTHDPPAMTVCWAAGR